MTLKQTPLDALHRELGARMVPFAGYDMPVQYPDGIIKEHQKTRESAGLFDVSHMGQVIIEGDNATAELEALVPADLVGLEINKSIYSLLMNDEGGVRDDLIITKWAENRYFIVVNAACKTEDIAYFRENLTGCSVTEKTEQGLLALQGPKARAVMARLCPEVANLVFMSGQCGSMGGKSVYITCSGYTGEDGFEVSMAAEDADAIARLLLSQEEVEPVGLGARDSLRLEAGLCLYGHELSPAITPIEAGLKWAISPARRPEGARAGGYPGAEVLATQMSDGAERKRIGLQVDGKRPIRDGQVVMNTSGATIGEVCSGAYGPTVGGPIGMAYVKADEGDMGGTVVVDVRGKPVPATIVKLPMVKPGYYRG